MKVRYKSDRIEIEVEGQAAKDCFDQLANAVEIFGASVCGACDSKNTTPVVRENQGNTFRELQCHDCGASLAFGQRKVDGALYPRRRDKEGNRLDGNGWTKWKDRRAQEVDTF